MGHHSAPAVRQFRHDIDGDGTRNSSQPDIGTRAQVDDQFPDRQIGQDRFE